ncbi:MAG: hypothetical protein ABMA14_00560 [Hyphomonadaceae bacterium]
MPTLPLDHPDPLAATLATMLYPGTEDRTQRQVLVDRLAPLLCDHCQPPQPIAIDQLMGRAVAVVGAELPDLEDRIFGATAVGQVAKVFLVLSWNDGKTASWANAYAIANKSAGPRAKRQISPSYFKMQRARFETVTHLWVALCLRDLQFKPEILVGYDLAADFDSFLAEAEWVRRWGSWWRRPATDAAPPFKGIEMWEPPFYWRPLFRRRGWPRTGGMADLALAPELVSGLKARGRPHKPASVNTP